MTLLIRQSVPATVLMIGISALAACMVGWADAAESRPNILFAIADDWGWPHAGAYNDPVVRTPAFDRIAREGVLFHHAYVSSPSCTPSRNAILTGQWHWRLAAGANLWSVFPDRFVTYPELLKQSGYEVGVSGKGFGPGRPATKNRELAGKRFKNFRQFLAQRDASKPFCFWLGSSDPHRPYKTGSGAASGMDLDKIRLPACLPDDPVVRSDVADYYWEVQRFDALVGAAMQSLEQTGELDKTIVLMTGDHGMPFPRCKANVYDSGSRVPLAVRWPAIIKAGRTVDDFVSFTDFAPTFLEAAGLTPPADMTGRALTDLFASEKSGRIDPARSYVLFGKERHVPGQEAPDMGGYPCRAIRTHEFLYIRNYRPDRWPNGTPDYGAAVIPGRWLADSDNGPTKTYMVEQRDKDRAHRRLYDLAFAKRPAEELYDLDNDPDQFRNIAADSSYAEVKQKLAAQLAADLKATADPRVLGSGDLFDKFPYLGGSPRHPQAKPKK